MDKANNSILKFFFRNPSSYIVPGKHPFPHKCPNPILTVLCFFEVLKVTTHYAKFVPVSHITPCYPPTASRQAVIPVKSIVEKVVYMHFADVTDCTFVAVFPNTIEGD